MQSPADRKKISQVSSGNSGNGGLKSPVVTYNALPGSSHYTVNHYNINVQPGL